MKNENDGTFWKTIFHSYILCIGIKNLTMIRSRNGAFCWIEEKFKSLKIS